MRGFVIRFDYHAREMIFQWLSLAANGPKIGEGFWPLGFDTAVLIKPIFGKGDLESSQQRSGVPEGTARVSVAARDLSFLTEIFWSGVADAEKAQKAG
jgi:hypothetical protein